MIHSDFDRLVFENTMMGVLVFDEQQKVVRANPLIATILGYENEAALLGLTKTVIFDEHVDADSLGSLATIDVCTSVYKLHTFQGGFVHCEASNILRENNEIWVFKNISSQMALTKQLAQERRLFLSGPVVVFHWEMSEGWPVKYVSSNVLKIMGYEVKELLSDRFHFATIIHPDDMDEIGQSVESSINNRSPSVEQSYRIRCKDETYRLFYDYTCITYHGDGSVDNIYGYLLDMTDYLSAQKISTLILTNTSEGIFGIDQEGNTNFINPAAAKLLGYTEDELIGQNNHALIHHSNHHGECSPKESCRMIIPIKTGVDEVVSDEVLWRKDGTFFHVDYKSTPIFDKGVIRGVVVTFSDITERRQNEIKIEHLALHDALTGLPNRRVFNTRLVQLDKEGALNYAVLLLDLDHFKDVNDSLGHPVGDELLKQVAERINKLIRPTDVFSRLGGDEFVVLMHPVKTIKDMCALARQISKVFDDTFEILNRHVKTNTSIGIAHCLDADWTENLLSQADIALYRAKGSGRANYVVFEPSMALEESEKIAMLAALVDANENKEFSVVYQPQVNPHTLEVDGFEALMRWHPTGGGSFPTSPDRFIPLLEERSLIYDATFNQLNQVMTHIPVLRQSGFKGKVSVNLSGKILSHFSQFLALVKHMKDSGFGYDDIGFEITETAQMNITEDQRDIMNGLHDEGLLFSIDDFGTGYSSFASLREFSSSYLKIDKVFVDNITESKQDFSMVSAMVAMAHALGQKVVIEGVETKAQLMVLEELNCDVIQGYYFSKPLLVEDAMKFCTKKKRESQK